MARKANNQSGFAAVELTVVTPILLVLSLLAVDFGRVMYESIVTTSAAASSTGYGFFYASDVEKTMDQTAMSTIAKKDSASLNVKSGQTDAITIVTERLCRCYDSSVFNGGGSLGEPTAAVCSQTCSGEKEVYIQTSVTRNFYSTSNYLHIPDQVTITRLARYRAQ
ncbi:pilus assembly protein [Vibrio sp. T187]|uniref:TadE family protein n=1 Tax=Vibrio TaxID=662 RepID=UPI0010C9BE90|nr:MULTISPECIES: TadE family protein [Vibrio]MBW3696780.1 pilus assembly protein [Vibrio sp. T187]